jgi:hypothetical protein
MWVGTVGMTPADSNPHPGKDGEVLPLIRLSGNTPPLSLE